MSTLTRVHPVAHPDLDGFTRPGAGRTACLLLHGFTCSPREIVPLADALAAAGFPVRAIRLPGHGTHVEDLERTTAAEWIDAARRALVETSESGPVFIAGQSMGGLLAMLLAAREPARVHAVASLAAPSRVARWAEPFFRRGLWRLIPYIPKPPSDLPPEARAAHFTYDRYSMRALLALADLVRETRAALPSLACPLLLMHGRKDRSAPFRSASWLFDLAGTPAKRFVAMEDSHHLLTLDVEGPRVCAEVVSFFDAVERERRQPAAG